jgi:hypothetical protein
MAKQGPGAKVHLVSVVRHESATVLAQSKVIEKRDERQAAKDLFPRVPLAGRVTTMDALHTQRWEAETLLAAQGHYLMVVKPNQRTLYQDIQWAFEALPPLNRYEQEYWDYQRHEIPDRLPQRPYWCPAPGWLVPHAECFPSCPTAAGAYSRTHRVPAPPRRRSSLTPGRLAP